MTNFEWLKTLNLDEFTEWVGAVASGDVYDNVGDLKNFTSWCIEEKCHSGNCDACIKKWLKTERVIPMPTLENGMFVTVYIPSYGNKLGVVVEDKIIYKEDRFDTISMAKNNIIKVYKASCFDYCDDEHTIWRKL